MKIEVSSVSDIGKKRSQNQDAILVYQDAPRDFGLFLVADGMGGHSHGERASGEIASGMQEWASQADGALLEGSAAGLLDAARDKLAEINTFIWEAWSREEICGSTCSLLLVLREAYGVLSVGDSRVYLCRGLRQCGPITRDDVWENQESVRSQYGWQELRENPNYGRLLHAVGGGKELTYSTQTGGLLRGDVFALCSDGIYKMCTPRYLERKLRSCRRRKPDAVRDEILGEVYRNGAADNASLILVRCL